MNTMLRRFLAVGTFWKILVANALVVVGALVLVPAGVHILDPDLSSLVVLVSVTAVTLLANAVVLRLALTPLSELERAARRVAEGDLTARAELSPLADRPLAELTRTFNRMVESVQAQRQAGREVASRALSDAEQSKRRLSRDLREDTAQALAAVLLRLRALRTLDEPAREAALEAARAEIGAVIEQLRSFAGQLRPPSLELLGLDQVIEAYARTRARGTGIRVDVQRDSLRGLLEPEAELQLMRVLQDVIDRAIIAADRVLRIELRRLGDLVSATVRHDGGHGGGEGSPDPALFAIRERASYFGGTLDVIRDAGGTTLHVQFPLNRAA